MRRVKASEEYRIKRQPRLPIMDFCPHAGSREQEKNMSTQSQEDDGNSFQYSLTDGWIHTEFLFRLTSMGVPVPHDQPQTDVRSITKSGSTGIRTQVAKSEP